MSQNEAPGSQCRRHFKPRLECLGRTLRVCFSILVITFSFDTRLRCNLWRWKANTNKKNSQIFPIRTISSPKWPFKMSLKNCFAIG